VRWRRALGGLAVVALAGCGSTVQPGTFAPASAGGDTGLTVPSTAPLPTEPGTPDAGGQVTPPSPSTLVPTQTRRPTQGGSRTPRSSQSSAPAGSRTPTDHTPVKIGLLYGKDIGAAAALVGIQGLSTGDTLKQSQAMVRWVNSHGGMGGHPIQLSSYGISATGGGDPESAYQSGCTSLTQDHKVRYVVTILGLRPSSLPCFARAGVGVLDDQSGVSNRQMAQYSRYYAGPADYSMERSTADLVDALVRRGWLTPKSKVGAFTYDTPLHRAAVSGALVRALRSHGLRLTEAAAVPNTTEYWTQSGAVVLKFRAAGVDRVIPVGVSPLALMISASTQGYRPAYAVTSAIGPGALIEGTAPRDQLVNSVGIGWQPFLDIGKGKHPGPVSPNQTTCFKIMNGAGQGSSSATTKGFQAQICDLFMYLKAMGDAFPSLPADLLTASRDVLADRFRSPATYRSDLRRHPDGVASYRDLVYQQSCACYQYVGPLRRTPS
jgi:hypothetical protein